MTESVTLDGLTIAAELAPAPPCPMMHLYASTED